MATTTNYAWETPDDTDLVKDGAAAIRTLGSSIDTTTKALNPSTTLGDIEYRSSTANTNTRLGIGTTGQVLTVAGGVPSWATPAAGGTWSAWTPTLTGFSLGNGTMVARYSQIGKTVNAWFRFQFGSTSSLAATNNWVTLPVAASGSYVANQTMSMAFFWDNTFGAAYTGKMEWKSATEVRIQVLATSGTYGYNDYAGATIPVAYATSDAWEFFITYEAA